MTPFEQHKPLKASQLETLRALAEAAIPKDGSQKAGALNIGPTAIAAEGTDYLLDVSVTRAGCATCKSAPASRAESS